MVFTLQDDTMALGQIGEIREAALEANINGALKTKLQQRLREFRVII